MYGGGIFFWFTPPLRDFCDYGMVYVQDGLFSFFFTRFLASLSTPRTLVLLCGGILLPESG